MIRVDGRERDELRPIRMTKSFMKNAHGSVLIEWGNTRVLCTAMYDAGVPSFLNEDENGWLTAEYAMLPASTPHRKAREKGRPDGRGTEISRLIGRSLRSIIDLKKMPGYTVHIDCDVIEADGGTRTASITGAYVALSLCIDKMLSMALIDESPIMAGAAAVSCGVADGTVLLDLCYLEDSSAEADMNIVMSSDGGVIEIQGTGEQRPISQNELGALIEAAKSGIEKIQKIQEEVLANE